MQNILKVVIDEDKEGGHHLVTVSRILLYDINIYHASDNRTYITWLDVFNKGYSS